MVGYRRSLGRFAAAATSVDELDERLSRRLRSHSQDCSWRPRHWRPGLAQMTHAGRSWLVCASVRDTRRNRYSPRRRLRGKGAGDRSPRPSTFSHRAGRVMALGGTRCSSCSARSRLRGVRLGVPACLRHLQHPAVRCSHRLRGSCRLFQLVAVRRRRSGKTFNPKVVGSIPTRPIGEKTARKPNLASSGFRHLGLDKRA